MRPPVNISRISRQSVTASTMWITKKPNRPHAAMKCSERALWRPPSTSSSQGAAAWKPGLIASPVNTISGSSTPKTPP
jgi:hypothetical protein